MFIFLKKLGTSIVVVVSAFFYLYCIAKVLLVWNICIIGARKMIRE